MILNLTQHYATEDQIKAGVYDLQGEALTELKKTFELLVSARLGGSKCKGRKDSGYRFANTKNWTGNDRRSALADVSVNQSSSKKEGSLLFLPTASVRL